MNAAQVNNEDEIGASPALMEGLIRDLGDISEPKQALSCFNVTKKEGNLQSSGSLQLQVTCLFCKHTFAATGATRCVEHMAKCPAAPNHLRKAFSSLVEKKQQKKRARQEQTAIMTEEYRIKKVEHEKQQATLLQQKIRVGLKMAECAAADDAIADFFFANGISFNVADNSINSYYHRMISTNLFGTILIDEIHMAILRRNLGRHTSAMVGNPLIRFHL
ncbi:hypothetical protein AB1Y20_008850 [Prymnesium parvum]|uniref:Uncharacterized protein n=1 Tax=Prymnesium parvum TaxID=97485 RepID=A0AB34IUG5_PRYPA